MADTGSRPAYGHVEREPEVEALAWALAAEGCGFYRHHEPSEDDYERADLLYSLLYRDGWRLNRCGGVNMPPPATHSETRLTRVQTNGR